MDDRGAENQEDGDFELVVNRKKKKTRHDGSQRSQGTVRIATTSRTVLFAPTAPNTNLRKINQQRLSEEVEALAPGQFSEVRVNTRKNIIGTDARSEAGVLALLIFDRICGAPVRAFLPRSKNSRAGVISDVDPAITEEDLAEIINSGVNVVQARRLGASESVKVVFDGDTLPAHVKIGLVRHSVRPFVPRPLQCRKCYRIGHVAAACPNEATRAHCSESHTDTTCTAAPRCVNCRQPHAATATECPKLQKEKKICDVKGRQNLTFLK
ncbi:unnamed protein product, partial [Ixodes hexagonus]